jgi:hypothetical protein
LSNIVTFIVVHADGSAHPRRYSSGLGFAVYKKS